MTTTTPAPAYPPLSSYVVMILWGEGQSEGLTVEILWKLYFINLLRDTCRFLASPLPPPLSLLFEARAGPNVRWGFKRAFGCWAPWNGGALIYCGTAQSNFISPKLDATPTTGWCNEKSFSHSSRPRNRIMVAAAAAVRRDEDDRPEVGNLWQQFV